MFTHRGNEGGREGGREGGGESKITNPSVRILCIMDDTFVSLKSFIKCKTLFYVCNKQFQMNNYTCQNKPLCKFSFKNKEMQVFFPSNKPITKNTIIS